MGKYLQWLKGSLIFALIFMISGCLVATKTTVITPEIQSLFSGEYKVHPAMKDHMPQTVAVLPFVDLSGNKESVDVLRRGFYNHFSSLPFSDMEMHRVDDLLSRAGLKDADVISKTPPQELGRILGVDAVVTGDISNFDKFFAVLYSQVAVGADVKMTDTKTGQFLWRGKHTVRKHEGGFSTHPVGLIATVLVTALNVRDIQLLRANDDLFRDMVKTIPTPTLAAALRPPAITLLTQDSKGLPKKAGDEIRVVIQGAPKMRAWFDIGDYKKHIDMQEVEPGAYLGVYKVLPGDNIDHAIVTGYLKDDAGNTAQWVDALSSVTLDTRAPDVPGAVSAQGRDRRVSLRWEKSASPDLAGYLVYRSVSPLSGYTPLAKTEFCEYSDASADLTNLKTYYYRVSAVDFAGNESAPLQTQGMPIPPGPTKVSGTIDADTIWYAGASPYVLETDVVVKDKARLTIEPGTLIVSKGGALIIEGQIAARGDQDHIISFDASGEGVLWGGIVFQDVKDRENHLQHVRIQNAHTALTCRSSSPRIESSELTRNVQALLMTGAFSRPAIVQNTIHLNRGSAITVREGALPTITNNTICDNEQSGIVLETAAADITGNVIARNRQNGVSTRGARASLQNNHIADNQPFNLIADLTGEPFTAGENWWGSDNIQAVLSGIQGRVEIASILDAPAGQGKVKAVHVLEQKLGGVVNTDAYLTVARSPYLVTRDVILNGGATLFIQPGVVLAFEHKTSLIAEDGGIIARGTPEYPIFFTAASSSPAPGFYSSAAKLSGHPRVNSSFVYCVVKYATTAFDIYAGSPEVSYSHIAHSSQNAVFCRKDAAPVLSYNTFSHNLGEGAIKCVGMANPKIFRNNFSANAVAIQSFSTIHIDARHNWWGAARPGPDSIWGDNINIKPWLVKEEANAFRESR
ncbi:MAG: DUF799 family lipoprotein [Smithellaceae bacterium]